MKVTGPDGLKYDFPDDTTDQEITSFFVESGKDKKGPPDASKFLKETVSNIPSSAMNAVSGIASSLYKGATDPSIMLGPMKPMYDLYRNATGQDSTYKDIVNSYKERYSHPLQSLHDDPVGISLDALGALEGGAGALRGVGRALGAAAGGEGMVTAGRAISPASRLGTRLKGVLPNAEITQSLAKLASENPTTAHAIGSAGGLAAGSLIGHPYIGMAGGTSLVRALQKLHVIPPGAPEFGLSNVRRARLGPVEPVGGMPELRGLPPDETPFNPPERVRVPEDAPSGDFKGEGTGTKYTPNREATKGPSGKGYKVNPIGTKGTQNVVNLEEGPVDFSDVGKSKSPGLRYSPNKEALKGTTGKSYRVRRPVGPPEVKIEPESATGQTEEIHPDMPQGLIDEIQNSLVGTEPGKTAIRTKSSARLRKEAADREALKNATVKPVESASERAKVDPRMKELAESLKTEDPYEIKIEEK